MIKIALLGSTGSIGVQTLSIAERYPDKIQTVSLAAGSNTRVFLQQVEKFAPKVATFGEVLPKEVTDKYKDTEFVFGTDAYLDAVIDEADIVVVALVGFIGIKAVLKSIEKGKNIALANKESLVVGGKLVSDALIKNPVKIFPVDSEHSAIWQCLELNKDKPFKKLIITGSGGAFRDTPLSELKNMSAADALKHPNWAMGKKITVDCATMVNKGFEVIEAKWLFNAPFEKIQVVLHRESIIHSMVEFADNAVLAQLGSPSMEVPIQLAVLGERMPTVTSPVDFLSLKSLTFVEIDEKRYPCFYLTLDCAKKGASYTCALNAANEIAVDAFLNGKIKFTDIYTVLKKVVDLTKPCNIDGLETLEKQDIASRTLARKIIGELNGKFIS